MYKCILSVLLYCSLLPYNHVAAMPQKNSNMNQLNDMIKNLEDAGNSLEILQVSGPGQLRKVISEMETVKKLNEVNQADLIAVIKDILERNKPPKNADATYSALCYLLEMKKPASLVPVLINFYEKNKNRYTFCPSFVVNTLKVITQQDDINTKYYTYSVADGDKTVAAAKRWQQLHK